MEQGKKLEKPDLGIRWNTEAETRYQGAIIQTSVDPESSNTYIDVYKGSHWASPVFDEDKDYLWPVPLNVIAQNPNVGQHPGY